MTCGQNNMAAGVKKKDEKNDHILYNLLVHAEWNLDGEVLVGSQLFCEHFKCLLLLLRFICGPKFVVKSKELHAFLL
jgi:hypothetical protein